MSMKQIWNISELKSTDAIANIDEALKVRYRGALNENERKKKKKLNTTEKSD